MRKDQGDFNKNVMLIVRRDGSQQVASLTDPFTGKVMSKFIFICILLKACVQRPKFMLAFI